MIYSRYFFPENCLFGAGLKTDVKFCVGERNGYIKRNTRKPDQGGLILENVDLVFFDVIIFISLWFDCPAMIY